MLWREGRDYPRNYPAMKQLLADGGLGIVFAFNPAEASSAIAAGELPDTVRSFVFPGGTLGNTHFVAIPYNSSAKAAAMVVANFLHLARGAAAQGGPGATGAIRRCSPWTGCRRRTERPSPPSTAASRRCRRPTLGPALPEPHPSWMTRIEQEWQKRYGS